MYELIPVTPHCYYIQSPAKIGLVELGEGEVCLIDSGNDKDAGRRVRKVLDANGWKLACHLQHPFQRRPHRRQPVPPAPDRLRHLRPRHRLRLHPSPRPGARLPVRRLPAQGTAAQIPDGSAQRRPVSHAGVPAGGVGEHSPAWALLRHGGLPHPGGCGLPGGLPVQQGDVGQVPHRRPLRRGGLSGYAGAGKAP